MNCNKLYFLLLLFGISNPIFSQYITVDDTYTAQQLVRDVLVKSPCTIVSNFSVTGDTFSGSVNSYGYFNAGTSNFPFADGIILTTSSAKKAVGPNTTLIDDKNRFWLGDNDLELAVDFPTDNNETFNATVLEFDFTPLSNDLSFDYIFASEEYDGTAPCRYSDGFAFLIKEKNSTNPYENLAIIPNTTLPVLITNIHPFISGSNGCIAQNEAFFAGYNGTNSPTNYNGQTVVMKAQKNNLIPNTTYHIKLVIADHENARYDSAIFLSGNSFVSGSNLGDDRLLANQNALCQGETLNLIATFPGNPPCKWYKDNVLQPQTTGDFTVTTTGTYKVEVIVNSNCTFIDEVVIEYSPLPPVSNVILIQCDDDSDGLSVFDLKKAIVTNDPALTIVNYYRNSTDTNEISNPEEFTSTSPNQQVFAKVKNQYGCISFATITLQVMPTTIGTKIIELCDTYNAQDGITNLQQADINLISTQLLVGLPSRISITYYTSIFDAIRQRNPIILPFLTTATTNTILIARFLDGQNCFDIQKIELKINTFKPTNFEDAIVGICSGEPTNIEVALGFSNYSWVKQTPPNEVFTNNSNTITVTSQGTYTVEVTNSKGCKAIKKFRVEASEKAIITGIEIVDLIGDDNTVLINTTGNGNYSYSIDGIVFQDSNLFSNVPAGQYELIVNDKNGCGETPANIIVLSYPTFFTPNNDGFNDTWIIENIAIKPNKGIQIFDRFGKLLASTTTTMGWNGKSNGAELPSDDYWFVLILESGREIKGHFALKR